MNAFEPLNTPFLSLKNRLIRSATFEGLADSNGLPGDEYAAYYASVAEGGVGGIITGFTYISQQGKAMHPGQAGIDSRDKIPYFRKVTEGVHRHDCKIYLQIAHTGRQSLSRVTGMPLVAPSVRSSPYFRQKPLQLTVKDIYRIIDQFADSACYAREAGFDGIQLHAAHGYLVHQFLIPSVNKRKDEFGIDPDTMIGTLFLKLITECIRKKCGPDFTLLIKISGSDDLTPEFSEEQFINLVRFLDGSDVSAIEISYGTMDYALNIFRGDIPEDAILNYNPVYATRNGLKRSLIKHAVFPVLKKKLIPFSPTYNLHYTELAGKLTKKPLISVGGFRSAEDIENALSKGKTDLVGLSRVLICEPDFIEKLKGRENYISACKNCNMCAIMCDSQYSTKCYQKNLS